MYTIAICDDDKNYVEIIKNEIKNYVEPVGIGINIVEFSSGEELLTRISKDSSFFDIIFLDIDMPKIDGIKAAKKLRENGVESVLIFVTSMEDKVFDAFGYNALKFVLKKNLKTDLKKAFSEAITKIQESNEFFDFKTLEGNIFLSTSEILYFYYESRRVNIKTFSGKTHGLLSLKLADIEKEFCSKGFILINRNTIVNIKYVRGVGINKNMLELDSGELLDISRPKLKEVHKAIANYIIK